MGYKKRYEIPMSDEVCSQIKQISSRFSFSRIVESIGVTFLGKTFSYSCIDVLRAVILLLTWSVTNWMFVFLAWLSINWVAGLVGTYNFGWHSTYGSYIFWGLAIVSFLYSCIEVSRCKTPKSEFYKDLKKDIAKKVVEVTEYCIKNVKIFEDPKHGGYIYFLLTYNNEIVVFFDSESQDLAIGGYNPKDSAFKPRKTLKIHRTLFAKYIVSEEFIGDPLEFSESKLFISNTKKWPEHGQILHCNWNRIDFKYS